MKVWHKKVLFTRHTKITMLCLPDRNKLTSGNIQNAIHAIKYELRITSMKALKLEEKLKYAIS